MNNEELNKKIAEIEDEEKYNIKGLENKQFPYIGWFWRDVDFDSKNGFPIGEIETSDMEKNNLLSVLPISIGKPFIGFIENNKWGYPERYTTEEETKKIKAMVEDIANNTTYDKLQALFDYMQTLKVEVK